jgi:nucleoside-diphosphate-sugar epimerase
MTTRLVEQAHSKRTAEGERVDERAKLHVVMGTGPLGLAVARHLRARGDRVRAANRSGRADLPESVEVVGANVADPAEAKRACDGAAVVYHCANPPYAKCENVDPSSTVQSVLEPSGLTPCA